MIKYALLSCITAFLGISSLSQSLKAQTIGQRADKVQFILKSYAYNYPEK